MRAPTPRCAATRVRWIPIRSSATSPNCTSARAVVHIEHGVGRYLGLANARDRRRRFGIPDDRIRRRSEAVCAGHGAAPDLALRRCRRSARAAASARLGSVGQGKTPRRRKDPRCRRGAAEHLRAPRSARRHRAGRARRGLPTLRRSVPVRRHARSTARHRRSHCRSDEPEVDGPADLRRRRFRQDRSRDARRVHRRAEPQAGGDSGADHAAGAAASRELQRPLRRLAGADRGDFAAAHRQRNRGGSPTTASRRDRHRHRHAQAVEHRVLRSRSSAS